MTLFLLILLLQNASNGIPKLSQQRCVHKKSDPTPFAWPITEFPLHAEHASGCPVGFNFARRSKRRDTEITPKTLSSLSLLDLYHL
jgi:hypothetical protein